MASDNKVFLAVDLGAESGRVVAGHFDGETIALEELHRFSNGPVNVQGRLYWDILKLWAEIKTGLKKAADQFGDRIIGIGVDTWGVDYGLLDKNGLLLGIPYHYRDMRTDDVMDKVFDIVSKQDIFEVTGLQFMQLNSLFQLASMVFDEDPTLQVAETFLNFPDLLNYWLTGCKASEFSIVSTTQCYDPRKGDWAYDLLEKLGIPPKLFGEIVLPGTVLGEVMPEVQTETGLGPVPVIAVAAHDTGSAVAAVPMDPDSAIYLSSGTWSLMGVESKTPIINDDMLAYNLTNEGGVEGTFRILKNIMGLWLVQEYRREWQRQGEDYDYGEMVDMAAAAPAFGPLVNPSDALFLAPGDMTSRITEFCKRTGQSVPESKGAFLRCALESLALEYRWVAEKLDTLTGSDLKTIHIIGGGSKNELLDQFAANAAKRTVVTGPVEATALGNVLVQAVALGKIESIAEGRKVIANSFDVRTFKPQDGDAWDAAYARYLRIRG